MADKPNDADLRKISDGIAVHILQDHIDRAEKLSQQKNLPISHTLVSDYVFENLKDPKTQGFVANPEGTRFVLYNPERNDIIMIGPGQGQGGTWINFGSNKDYGQQNFDKFHRRESPAASISSNGIEGAINDHKARHGSWPDLKSVAQHMDAKLSAPEFKPGMLDDLGKKAGIIGPLIGGIAATGHLLNGNPAQAAETMYEASVPYGETQIDLARGDVEAAERSAAVETASNIGSVVGCAVAGGAAALVSFGTASPAACLVGGAALGVAAGKVTELILGDDKPKAQYTAQEVFDALPAGLDERMNTDDLLAPTQAGPLTPPPEILGLSALKDGIETVPLARRGALMEQFNAQYVELEQQGSMGEVNDYVTQRLEEMQRERDLELQRKLSEPQYREPALSTSGASISLGQP